MASIDWLQLVECERTDVARPAAEEPGARLAQPTLIELDGDELVFGHDEPVVLYSRALTVRGAEHRLVWEATTHNEALGTPEFIGCAELVKRSVLLQRLVERADNRWLFVPWDSRWIELHPGAASSSERVRDFAAERAPCRPAVEHRLERQARRATRRRYLHRGDGEPAQTLAATCAKTDAASTTE